MPSPRSTFIPTNRRTTPQLVTTAIQGAEDAGRDVVAVDVHGGGFVRIYFKDPNEVTMTMDAETKCSGIDHIFETGSA